MNLNDYIRFTDLLCNNGVMQNGKRIIAESSVKLFYEHYLPYDILTKRSPFGKCGYSYGFGFRSLISKEFGSKSPIGEFGWDGAAGSFALIDPINNISLVYIQDILYCNYAFEVLHPNIRDLTYSAILN